MTDANFAISADGTRIAWYDFGGTGPAVLLGHATGFCAHVWAPVIEALRDDFHLYGYDLRGHGLSSRPTGERNSAWNWHRYADDVASVLVAAELEQPISVGHSCGAATALLLEERTPGTFSQLIGFEPVTFVDVPPKGPDENRDLAVRTRTRRTNFASKDDVFDAFSRRGPFVDLVPSALRAYAEYGSAEQADGSVVLRCHPEDEAAVYVMASDHDGFVNLDRVEAPVTVVRGADSVAFDEPTLRAVAGRVQNGSFIEMADCGHFGALEQPEQFMKIVRERAGGQ